MAQCALENHHLEYPASFTRIHKRKWDIYSVANCEITGSYAHEVVRDGQIPELHGDDHSLHRNILSRSDLDHGTHCVDVY